MAKTLATWNPALSRTNTTGAPSASKSVRRQRDPSRHCAVVRSAPSITSANVFPVSDYGLVANCKTAIPEMMNALTQVGK
jgi:hypothetical protein